MTNEYASGGRAGWGIVVLLAIVVTGLGWWLTREPAAPVIATQVVTPPPVVPEPVAAKPEKVEEVIPPPTGPEVPGGDEAQPGTGGKDTGAAVKRKKPAEPKPSSPEAAPVTATEEPPVMGLIRVSLLAEVNCEMLIDGVPRLRGMTRDIYATVKDNGTGSQPQSVPVGEHQIGCRGGPTETVTVTSGSAARLVTITRKAAP